MRRNGLACVVLMMLLVWQASTGARSLDEPRASRFAALALACVDKEFPNIVHHVMAGAEDVDRPSRLTPAFYGCFDWHSAVHGHWLLVRLARLHPEAPFAEEARTALARTLTQARLLQEAAYMAHPERAGFERPYGHAWLLQLVAELEQWDDAQARQWREWLRPLEQVTVQRLSDWLPKLRYPIRGGEHYQTAFAFGLIHDYAVQVGDHVLRERLVDAGRRFYERDRDCPLAYEPSGHDFLSPCLAEADFMRRILPPDDFARWLTDFLPTLETPDWLPIGQVSDRADGKLAHIDGLNISRAWMLEGIAAGLPDDDARRFALQATATAHGDAGVAGVSDTHYAGSHWLASFAVYWLSQRGMGH
ncbi:DUF2891 domain-containing protein [Xanthomonadaceae bacterium JHOS43]|nr:DUF2891 domain-containing protein [Xanthomonadaceae bacterium JHOS43]